MFKKKTQAKAWMDVSLSSKPFLFISLSIPHSLCAVLYQNFPSYVKPLQPTMHDIIHECFIGISPKPQINIYNANYNSWHQSWNVLFSLFQMGKEKHIVFPPWVEIFAELSHFLMTFNCSVNFFIYLVKILIIKYVIFYHILYKTLKKVVTEKSRKYRLDFPVS